MIQKHVPLFLLSLLVILVSCGPSGPSTIPVNGTVVSATGSPVSGATVWLNHTGSPFTTGADGKFTFSGVTTPYSLSVKTGTDVAEFQGLTRNNPQITTSTLGIAFSATVSGNVTGPTYPLAADETVLLSATNNAFASLISGFNTTTGAYTKTIQWSGGSNILTDLVALRVKSAGGTFSDFLQLGKKSGVTLSNSSTLGGQNIALDTGVTTSSTVLTFTPGAYTASSSARYWSIKAGGAVFPLILGGPVVASGSTAKFPSEGASFVVRGKDAAGNQVNTVVPATAGATNVNLPTSVALQNGVPGAGATGLTKTPTFSWSNVSGASAYILTINGPISYTVYLPGTTNSFVMPDYSVLSAQLSGSTAYTWTVAATINLNFAPDAFTDPAGSNLLTQYISSSGFTIYTSASTNFTTAP